MKSGQKQSLVVGEDADHRRQDSLSQYQTFVKIVFRNCLWESIL